MLLKPIAICLVFAAGVATARAQDWVSGFRWGGAGQESIEALAPFGSGSFLAGGSFTGSVYWNGRQLVSRGEEDIFLLPYQPGIGFGEAIGFGGPGSDVLSELVPVPDGGVLGAGEFWQELVFEDGYQVESGSNAKALFMARWSQQGALVWAQPIVGGSLKVVRDIAWGDSSIYAAGYFSDSLVVDSLVLRTASRTAAFLLKFDAEGQVQWGQTLEGLDDVRAMAMTLSEDKYPVIAGKYNRQLITKDTVLLANTRDWDIFLASFSENGQLRWIRKAGGVYDDEVEDIASDADGDLYLCGKLVGVLQLAAGWTIQSLDGNADGFLLKYTKEGQPVWAGTFPGRSVQEALRVKVALDKVAVLGLFQGTLEWGGKELRAESVYQGFMGILDTAGQASNLVLIASDKGLLPTALLPDSGSSWLLGGGYQGTGTGSFALPASAGGFDAFLLNWGAIPTAVEQREPAWASNLQVAPNPAWDTVRVTGSNWDSAALFSASGQLVRRIASGKSDISVQDLPSGVYFFQFIKDVTVVWRKLWIQR